MIQLDQEIRPDLEDALTHEWSETNGLVGFASPGIVGPNIRRWVGRNDAPNFDANRLMRYGRRTGPPPASLVKGRTRHRATIKLEKAP